MPFFKRKPVIIEAERFVIGLPLPFFDKDKIVHRNNNNTGYYVVEPSGRMVTLQDGDWIFLSDSPGRAHVCPHHVFIEIYELMS